MNENGPDPSVPHGGLPPMPEAGVEAAKRPPRNSESEPAKTAPAPSSARAPKKARAKKRSPKLLKARQPTSAKVRRPQAAKATAQAPGTSASTRASRRRAAVVGLSCAFAAAVVGFLVIAFAVASGSDREGTVQSDPIVAAANNEQADPGSSPDPPGAAMAQPVRGVAYNDAVTVVTGEENLVWELRIGLPSHIEFPVAEYRTGGVFGFPGLEFSIYLRLVDGPAGWHSLQAGPGDWTVTHGREPDVALNGPPEYCKMTVGVEFDPNRLSRFPLMQPGSELESRLCLPLAATAKVDIEDVHLTLQLPDGVVLFLPLGETSYVDLTGRFPDGPPQM